MAAPTLSAGDFQRLERIGRGSFGNVYRGVHLRTGAYVALKVVDLENGDDDVDVIQREVATLSQCRSRFVTEYIGCLLIPERSELWIVMEHMAASVKDLLERGPLSEASAGTVLRGALNALGYLHSQKKIHRDMKAANLLVSSRGVVKLADFGVSGTLSMTLGSKRASFVGTPFWMAPEVIQQGGAAPSAGGVFDGYNESADIWSMGITLIEMLKGEPPWADIHPMRVLFLIPKEPAPRLDASVFGADACDLLVQCCNKDSKARPSARALLEHPFVANAPEVTDELMEKIQARVASAANDRKTSSFDGADGGGTGTVIGGQSWGTRRGNGGGIGSEQGSIGNDDSGATTAFWDFDTVRARESVDSESPSSNARITETPTKLRAVTSSEERELARLGSGRGLRTDTDSSTRARNQQLATLIEAMHASSRGVSDKYVVESASMAFEKLEAALPGFSGRFLAHVQRQPSPASSPLMPIGMHMNEDGKDQGDTVASYTLRKFLSERWKHMNAQEPSILGLSSTAKAGGWMRKDTS